LHPRTQLRCPLLRPDPTARPRLVQIRNNLIARITEAEAHRWIGEAEGLKVSLAGANAKLAQMDQISARRRHSVQLGMPTFTDAAGRTNPSTPPSLDADR
jgi:hypothetical protein